MLVRRGIEGMAEEVDVNEIVIRIVCEVCGARIPWSAEFMKREMVLEVKPCHGCVEKAKREAKNGQTTQAH